MVGERSSAITDEEKIEVLAYSVVVLVSFLTDAEHTFDEVLASLATDNMRDILTHGVFLALAETTLAAARGELN